MNLFIADTPYKELFPRTMEHVLRGIGIEYSCAAAAIVRGDRTLLQFCAGNRQDYSGDEQYHADPKPVSMETLYDMASVTKLAATTMVALRMMEDGAFSLYDSLWRYFKDAGNFRDAEIRHLMTHSSGLTPGIALYTKCQSPEEAIPMILHSEPVCGIGEDVHYSCMGYLLLQKILEQIGGKPLDVLADELVFKPLGMKTACFNPTAEDIAATEFSPHYKRYVCGHVHDENAHFLGGVCGNAGLFASIGDMTRFASMLSNRGSIDGKRYLNRRTFDLAVKNYTPGMSENRGLGFSLRFDDLSSSGEFTSPGSYGHNGFTGTSVYCDAQSGICMVLLTNAVHYGRENRGPFFRDRRIFHNIALTEADRALGLDI